MLPPHVSSFSPLPPQLTFFPPIQINGDVVVFRFIGGNHSAAQSTLCAFLVFTDGRPWTHAISVPSPATRLAYLHTILTRGLTASSPRPVLLTTVSATPGPACPGKPQLKPSSKEPQLLYSKFPSILKMRTPRRACLPEI